MTELDHSSTHKKIKAALGDRRLLFLALGGSHAYGTSRPDSDVDYRGVHVYPTTDYLGVKPPTNSKPLEIGGEDIVIHELSRFISLALDNNPNILEILFSPEVVQSCREFNPFLKYRDQLLSQRCRVTYGGYANQQVSRFKKSKAEGTLQRFREDHRLKHLVHCYRLVDQCTNLLKTGTLDIVVHNKEELYELATKSFDDVDFFEREFGARLKAMDTCDTDLPEKPKEDLWNNLLIEYHFDYLGL